MNQPRERQLRSGVRPELRDPPCRAARAALGWPRIAAISLEEVLCGAVWRPLRLRTRRDARPIRQASRDPQRDAGVAYSGAARVVRLRRPT